MRQIAKHWRLSCIMTTKYSSKSTRDPNMKSGRDVSMQRVKEEQYMLTKVI